MQLVAKARLAEYKTRLGGDGVGRVVRYLSERAAHHLAGLDPIHSRQHDQSHLRDPEWQAKMFAYREERITASAARRMAARLERGTDPFLAAVECQDHLLALGEASIDRVIFEAFRDGLSGEASPEVRAMLEPLAQLHALSRLEHHLGWFLETGVIEGVKSRAIRAQVNALCAEIRPNAVAYVDGFGIPDGLLAAPIAFSALPTA
jgi:acyl-CoA oxidase